MAQQKQYECKSEKLSDYEFKVLITVGMQNMEEKMENTDNNPVSEETVCLPDGRKKKKIVVLRSGKMGEGNDELGATLMKGFLYALTQQEELPSTILFYDGGAFLTCEGSKSLEDLKALEAQGVEILTCGTCLNFYGISETLAVGGVTNMYDITEKMMKAGLVIKP